MEDDLDAISRGEQESTAYLNKFYFGNGAPGLKKQLEHKIDEIDPARIGRIAIGKPNDGPEIFVRVGRYSPFVEQGERKASLPEDLPPDEVTLEKALALLEQAQQGEEPLGFCPTTGKPVYLKVGRFGPYVQRGTPDDEEKPQNASLLRGMAPADVDLATALKLLELPRTVGNHPTDGKPIVAYNGRFGPYVKWGEETRSLPADISPLEVTLDQAVHLLAQPKTRGRGAAAKKEPLRVFDKPSPATENPIQILDGRYGAYVTDGTTNVSLRKGMSVEELTFDEAVTMLAEKAAQGPPPKKAARKSAAPKTAATAKSAATKTATKKSAKKKSVAKRKSV
jgi:DNA topoisomerase-1